MSLTDGPLRSDTLTTPADGQAAAAEAFRNSLTVDPTINKVVFQVRVLTPVINVDHTFKPGDDFRNAARKLYQLGFDPLNIGRAQASLARESGRIDPDSNPTAEQVKLGIGIVGATMGIKVKEDSSTLALSDPDTPAAPGTLPTGYPVGSNKYYFWGRILAEDDAPFPSPHAMYADPCDLHATIKPTRALELIQLHTKFIAKSGYAGATPTVGDIVEVTLDKGDISYNLQYCHFDEISDVTQKEVTNAFGEEQCSSLKNAFDNWDGDSTGFSNKIAIPGGTVGPEWSTNPAERNLLIDNFYAALTNFGMPKGFRVSSRGRTVGYGQNMIMRFADKCKIPRTPGPAPKSDNANWDPAEITRLCAALKKCGIIVAEPHKSPHCKPGGIYKGQGCTGGSLNRIAFDTAGADLWQISSALTKFKNAPLTNPNGYQALLKSGKLLSTFVTFGWTGGPKCPPTGFGWCVEAKNGCVHIEIVPVEKVSPPIVAGGAAAGPTDSGAEDVTINNEEEE